MTKSAGLATVAVARVNLLPKSEVDKRERERLTRAWAWGVVGAVILTLLIIAGAFWLNILSAQRLATEQVKTSALLLELSNLSDVAGSLATEAELTEFRALAMSTDLSWVPIVSSITSVLPNDALMTGFELASGAVPEGDDPTLEVGLTGIVSVESPRPLDIVDISRALRGVEGIQYTDGESVVSSASTGGRFAYILNVTFDQTVYTSQYTTVDGGAD